MTSVREFTVLHLFAGIGGGALGFQRARAKYGNLEGRFRTLVGIDLDPAACADFRRLTGAKAVEADLATMTPAELLAACGGEAPDAVFLSAPCKSFSGLLPKHRLEEVRYQKLNTLMIQGLWLVLETFRDRPPKLLVSENVPLITRRGAQMLRQIRDLLGQYGYRTHEDFHDCGVIGGLAQHRRRWLLVARHEGQVPTFVYHPPKQRVRAIGEVLEQLPMPDDPRGGPMHRLPRLQWKTWDRLARIPAGGDWRALGVRDGSRYNNQLQIVPWDRASNTVTGASHVNGGLLSVSDPRLDAENGRRYNNVDRIVSWGDPSVAVTGGGTPTSGGVCVADPRVNRDRFAHSEQVTPWTSPAGTVTSAASPSCGAASVADPRFGCAPRAGGYGVTAWSDPQPAIVGAADVHAGQAAVADPRLATAPGKYSGHYGVLGWEDPSTTVTGAARPVEGTISVADPRVAGEGWNRGVLGVRPWNEPACTVTGNGRPGSGAFTVADPRVESAMRRGSLGVRGWEQPSGTITGEGSPTAGPFAVADPRLSERPGRHESKFRVEDWTSPAHAITGSDRVGSGAPSVGDPRIEAAIARYGKWYRVVRVEPGDGSVAGEDPAVESPAALLPAPEARPDPPPVILALDGTWHRPLTTFELAAIQSLPVFDAEGRPLVLEGKSHTAFRERIGNCVPPDAAEAMASEFLRTLLEASAGRTFILVGPDRGDIWVRREHALQAAEEAQ